MNYLEEHGINKETAELFGLVLTDKKLTIPVHDAEGNFLFNKYRHLDFDKENKNSKKFSYDAGSEATLFNAQALLESDYVFLVEGEPDCIKMTQEGFPSVTPTSGAKTFKEEWVPLFEGKRVYGLYDSDKAGKEGIEKVKKLLPQLIVLELPEGAKDVCEYFSTHTKAEFKKMVATQIEENRLTYSDLCAIFEKYLLIPDTNVIRILLAVLVSHFFTTDPLWMFFVAPPSGSKTEIISTAAELPFVEMLSDLTGHTLLSGMISKKGEDPSLLLKLKNNVLIMKDFTTVLSMRQDERQIILSQLREVYDGKFNKAFGTGKKVDWEGRLTLIAGVTTIIDTHSSLFQVMGERFIMYRMPQSNDMDVAEKALDNYGSEKDMRKFLREAVKKYFYSLRIPKVEEIELPREIIKSLSALASFIVIARSGIIRDQYKRDITYIPATEAPSRLAKQLGTLIKALCVLEGRKVVTWDDYYMTLRVAFDIIPKNRMSHFIALCGNEYPSTTNQVAEETQYSRSGSESILEDLTALGVVSMQGYGSGSATEWRISSKSYDYFKKIIPHSSEELLKYFPESTEYSPLIKEMLDGKPIRARTLEEKQQSSLADF